MNKKKLLIIGAGISGLYSAYLLQDTYDVTLVEARARIGGRVMALGGHDLGPSWVWGHQRSISDLIAFLDLELIEQYHKGDSLYDGPEGVQRFNAPPSAPSARIDGGVTAIVNALAERLTTAPVLNTQVRSLTKNDKGITVVTMQGSYEADFVISTLPPRIAAETIMYDPALPDPVKMQFENIPTWMGYAAKCVIEYDDPFWRDEGLSGFAFSHLGPLGEVHDACTEETAALFGFLHSRAALDNREENILKQLTRMYGEKASHPKNIYLVDWKKEKYTSTLLDALPLREHPSYGFDVSHFDGKLIFSGTESAFQEGGYLEGAVNAAKKVYERLS